MLYDPEGSLSQIPEDERVRLERKHHEEKMAILHGLWRHTSSGFLVTAQGEYDMWCASLGQESLPEKMFARFLSQWQIELSMQAAARTLGKPVRTFRRGA